MIINIGVNLYPQAGGIYRTVVNFRDAWRSAGMDSRIVSFDLAAPPGTGADNIERIPLPNTLRGKLYHYWPGCHDGRMPKLLEGCSLLCVHGIYVHPLWHAARWALAAGVPFILIPHGSLDPYVLSYRKWRKRVWLALLRRRLIDGASTVVFSTKAELAKAAPFIKNADCRVVRSTVPASANLDRAAERTALRARYGWDSDQKVAVFCGRIHPMKRPLETIAAFVAADSPDWKLLLIGSPSPEIPSEEIGARCAASGGRCVYAGFRKHDEVRATYRGADLSILLSHRENFGYATAEAMAEGCPVLISSSVDLSAYVTESACGFVEQGKAPGDLARAVGTALSTAHGTLKEMGLRGHHWIEKNCDVEQFRSALLELALEP